MKQTKASKFRELLPTIENLLDSYTYKGVIETLEEDHNLVISEDTFSLYLHRERAKQKAKAKEIDSIEDSSVKMPKTTSSNASLVKVDISSEKKDIDVDQKEVKENNVSSAPSKEDQDKPVSPEELKAALKRMKDEAKRKEYNGE